MENTASDEKDRHAGTEVVGIQRHDVLLGIGGRHDLLFLADSAERPQGIAAFCRRLVAFLLGVGSHLLLQPPFDLAVLPLQQFRRALHGFAVLLARDLPGTDSCATSDLVINAGALLSDISREHARAGGQFQGFIQQSDEGIRSSRAGIRTEVARFIRVSVAGKDQSRILAARDFDIRVGFCVLQADIILGGILFDEGILE